MKKEWLKNRFQYLKEGNGKTNKILSALIFLVFAFNLIDQIYKNQLFTARLIYTIPYLICSILLYKYNWKIVLSFILLFIAYRVTYTGYISDLSGAFFFCLSALLIKKYTYNLFISMVTIILLTLRSMELEDTTTGALTIIVGYFSLYAIFYFIAYKPSINKQSKIQTLTDDENQLLTYLAYEDISQKEAGALMELKPNKANDMLKQVREKLGVTSMYSVVRLVAEYDKSKYRKDNSRK